MTPHSQGTFTVVYLLADMLCIVTKAVVDLLLCRQCICMQKQAYKSKLWDAA